LIGRAADRLGKFRVFLFGTGLSITMVLIYTHLGRIGLPLVVLVNVVMFVGIFSRMIPFQALVSSVPAANQRGSFNSISASIQQLSGGLASVLAGHIVTIGADGTLHNFDLVGYVVVATALVAATLMWRLNGNLRTAEKSPASA
jgi:Na+/melibiose symporter-like transporter